MSQDLERGWRGRDDAVQPSDPAGSAPPDERLDAQLADLVSYCRGLTSEENEADGTAHTVMALARSLLNDPDRLRAWLFALARREIVADGAPKADEGFDLVHRHGIRPEDLSVVLGIPASVAHELLAAAEDQYGIPGAGPEHDDASRYDDDGDDRSDRGERGGAGWA